MKQKIYNCLKSNSFLKGNGVSVFSDIPQNTNFPYIRIILDRVHNDSLQNIPGIKFSINFHIFVKNNINDLLIRIATHIENEMNKISLSDNQYILYNLYFDKASLNNKEVLTKHFILQFKATIRRREEDGL